MNKREGLIWLKKTSVLFLFITGMFFRPILVFGIEGYKVTGKISSGYDDNIYEQAEKKTGRSFLNLYLDSKFSLPRFKRVESILRLQNGFKIINKGENIALNQVDLRFAIPILPKVTSEIFMELKHKSAPVSSYESVQNEYGYLYWHNGFVFKYGLKNFTSSIKYLHRQQNYEDPGFSDSINSYVELGTSYVFSDRLTGCVTGKIENIRFSEEKRTGRQGRIDKLYEVSMGLQWLNGIFINPCYTLQKNESKIKEYSYYAHQFSVITAFPLWQEITLQFYGRIQFRGYKNQPPPDYYTLDEENADQLRKLLIFSLSKSILKNFILETRYLISESDISVSSSKYRKQVYSFAVSYSF